MHKCFIPIWDIFFHQDGMQAVGNMHKVDNVTKVCEEFDILKDEPHQDELYLNSIFLTLTAWSIPPPPLILNHLDANSDKPSELSAL